MILRFRCQDGTFRIEVQPTDDISVLYEKLIEVLPKNIDGPSILLSDKPANGSTRVLGHLAGQMVRDVGLNHGDMLFLSYQKAPANGTAASPAARISGKPVAPSDDVSESYTYTTNAHTSAKPNPWEKITPDPVDEALDKLDGKIHRPKDQKMCRHGPKGMCDYCMPLEPYDAKYLAEKKIKHLSFHAHLRKINTATNKPELKASYMPPLSEPFFRVKPNCPSGHQEWPAGICTKCQPSAITLQQQDFRMVDHVEFSDPSLIDTLLDFWRSTGSQRIGYLYGRYAPYTEVPLGIKAVVEAIYEPPQRCESDGVALTLPWEGSAGVDEVAALCGLRRVGVIFTDLTDDGTGNGTVICKRHIESYFLSSLEIAFAAKLQADNPHPSKWSDSGTFGSNFITCVISGNPEGGIDIFAYQASNTAVEMVRADIIEPSADPGLMLVREEDSNTRYIPEVFYQSKPLFIAPKNGFPVENREVAGIAQDIRAVGRQLGIGTGGQVGVDAISDFHLLCFLHGLGILNKDEERLLAQVATTHDLNTGFTLSQTGGWATLLTICQSSGELNNPAPRRAFAFLPSASRKRRYDDEEMNGNDGVDGGGTPMSGNGAYGPSSSGHRLDSNGGGRRNVGSTRTGGDDASASEEENHGDERLLTKKLRRISLK
ncbi:hypothetical protein ABW19_dt0210378 [Dactylella cylindrospora]|nr:hypothetical protein ABW19_dt0210378 [Dactylella cylindrospora]